MNTILASASGALSALFFDSFGSGAAEVGFPLSSFTSPSTEESIDDALSLSLSLTNGDLLPLVSRRRWNVSLRPQYDLGMALNGALAGLVAITGSCAFVEMWAALTIGAISGPVYVYGSRFTLNVLKIDDPLDATPVHLYCGIWGLIAGE